MMAMEKKEVALVWSITLQFGLTWRVGLALETEKKGVCEVPILLVEEAGLGVDGLVYTKNLSVT
jgi:hypothetical protein